MVGIRVGQFIGPLNIVYRTVKQQQNLSGWIYAKGLTKDRLPAETQPSRGVYICIMQIHAKVVSFVLPTKDGNI